MNTLDHTANTALKHIFLFLLILFLSYLFYHYTHLKTILAGIAIFLIGMHFLEEGFKKFSGTLLEEYLKKSTDTLFKSLMSGFVLTSIVQSSSLVSVIAISFLSAELLSLINAVGVIFGANLGTTATTWIVAYFGVKIKIAAFGLPMIVFGVMLRFVDKVEIKGLGNILLGLGFVFLGIDYLKTGFDTLGSGFDLSAYDLSGLQAVVLYTLIGAVVTVIIQSSSAAMAIIVTALYAGQITYEAALLFAVGSNIGTTVTAVLASLSSNENGKRLAAAHLIFNVTTGLVTILFLGYFIQAVDAVSAFFMIEDLVLKLAVFHTLFNLSGIVLLSGFIPLLVKYLQKFFIPKEKEVIKAKYLDKNVVSLKDTSKGLIKKEIEHFFERIRLLFLHALYVDEYISLKDRDQFPLTKNEINIDEEYQTTVKYLYGDILKYISLHIDNLDTQEEKKEAYQIQLALQYLVDATKDIKHLQKNMKKYIFGKNELAKYEYLYIRDRIIHTIVQIDEVRKLQKSAESLSYLELTYQYANDFNIGNSKRLNNLIKDVNVSNNMITSLINDSSYSYDIIKHVLNSAYILWVSDELKDLNKDEGRTYFNSRIGMREFLEK
jgi:phosphate:Na+ symporter